MTEITTGARVERLDGGYTAGRKGTVIAISDCGGRYHVQWNGHPKTWVKGTSLRIIDDIDRGPWVAIQLRKATHVRICRKDGAEWHEYKIDLVGTR